MSLFEAGLIPALDTDGNPINGAKWEFYASKTLTPLAVYADAGFTVSLGTSITSNAAGRFPTAYLAETSNYRAIFSLNGLAIRDIDPVDTVDPASLTYKRSATAYLTTVYGALARIAWLDDYIAPTDPTVSGYPDASAAFARAAADASVIVGTQGKIYYVKDVVLDGRQFDGQNCVLRDAPGARWGIKLSGYGPAARRFVFQDQGNYALSTTLSNAALTAANTVTVVNATNVEVGEVIFVELDANEVRHQTFVSGVAGTTITIRDAIPSGAAAGKAVDIMRSAVWVATANRWLVEDVIVVNARGALITMPEAVGQTSNLGTLRNFQTDGYRFFGWIKAGDCAGVKASDVKLWGGFVETFNYTGNGTAGPYSFTKRVFLLRDVTVTVNGVAQVYGTDWNYASQTSIQFLAGRFPGTGAAIAINHFRDGYRGFVEDQRNTAIISGGNLYDAVECLDAFVGASFFESDLTEVRSLISDTCQYVALQTNNCTNTLVFSGDTFCGYSGSSLKTFGSLTKSYNSLYTKRVPLADQWLGSLDDNIYIDATSELKINASGWSGEFQHTAAAGGKLTIVGGDTLQGRNVTNIAAGSTVYLTQAGHSANLADTIFRAPRDGTLKTFRADTDTAPGAAQSYTYDVWIGGASVGTVTISGASALTGTAALNTFVTAGTQVNLRLVTSAGAAAGARHFITATMV